MPGRNGDAELDGRKRSRRSSARSGRAISAVRDRRRTAARIRFTRNQVEEQARQLAELHARVEELTGELAAARRTNRREESIRERLDVARGEVAEAEESLSGRDARLRALDLNIATFEELREFGLSVTQSARLIAARDTRGGFTSLSELDGLSGFSRETLAALKQQATI